MTLYIELMKYAQHHIHEKHMVLILSFMESIVFNVGNKNIMKFYYFLQRKKKNIENTCKGFKE